MHSLESKFKLMTEVEVNQPEAAEAPVPAKKKFNRLDYILQNKNGETLVKAPGSINGKAFAIRFLENCTVHLFDHSAQVSHHSIAWSTTTASFSSSTCFLEIAVEQGLWAWTLLNYTMLIALLVPVSF